jgi:hypothetical protein
VRTANLRLVSFCYCRLSHVKRSLFITVPMITQCTVLPRNFEISEPWTPDFRNPCKIPESRSPRSSDSRHFKIPGIPGIEIQYLAEHCIPLSKSLWIRGFSDAHVGFTCSRTPAESRTSARHYRYHVAKLRRRGYADKCTRENSKIASHSPRIFYITRSLFAT